MTLQPQSTIDTVCKQVSLNLNEDEQIVHQIIMFQFKDIVDKMKDLDFNYDILLNELFKFKLKRRYKNNKTLKYYSHES